MGGEAPHCVLLTENKSGEGTPMEEEISLICQLASCVRYFIETGFVSFLLGRLLPKKWFVGHWFPYRCLKFENNGDFWQGLNVAKWQKKLPDMSRLFPRIMPPKSLSGDYTKRLPRMIQETCVAEWTHGLLCFTGLYCFHYLPGVCGFAVWIIYAAIFNLPFIIVQRYNRPRLMRVSERTQVRNKGTPAEEFPSPVPTTEKEEA
ncbi:MAG: hypothetical protein IK082_00485 [Oscillospiraceae bacterium]|nr:hypothetical protein [Oscillospiraceae bacterium]